jgi:WD40 repeat protein
VAFSPDGLQLASASRDKSARSLMSKPARCMRRFWHEEPVFGVAWDAAGKNVLSAGRDRKVRVWNAGDAKPVGRSRGLGRSHFT